MVEIPWLFQGKIKFPDFSRFSLTFPEIDTMCKKGGTSVAQNLMGNVKSKVRVFSLGEDIE